MRYGAYLLYGVCRRGGECMATNRYSVGLLIIAAGIVLLLGKLGVFAFLWKLIWPFVLLVPGLLFHVLYFSRTLPAGVLIPGGILVTYSLMFLFCNLFGWGFMAYLWPGFIFGVAVGLYEYYLFDKSNSRGVFLAAVILAVISGLFFSMTILFAVGITLIAIVLIVVGAVMLFGPRKSW